MPKELRTSWWFHAWISPIWHLILLVFILGCFGFGWWLTHYYWFADGYQRASASSLRAVFEDVRIVRTADGLEITQQQDDAQADESGSHGLGHLPAYRGILAKYQQLITRFNTIIADLDDEALSWQVASSGDDEVVQLAIPGVSGTVTSGIAGNSDPDSPIEVSVLLTIPPARWTEFRAKPLLSRFQHWPALIRQTHPEPVGFRLGPAEAELTDAHDSFGQRIDAIRKGLRTEYGVGPAIEIDTAKVFQDAKQIWQDMLAEATAQAIALVPERSGEGHKATKPVDPCPEEEPWHEDKTQADLLAISFALDEAMRDELVALGEIELAPFWLFGHWRWWEIMFWVEIGVLVMACYLGGVAVVTRHKDKDQWDPRDTLRVLARLVYAPIIALILFWLVIGNIINLEAKEHFYKSSLGILAIAFLMGLFPNRVLRLLEHVIATLMLLMPAKPKSEAGSKASPAKETGGEDVIRRLPGTSATIPGNPPSFEELRTTMKKLYKGPFT